MGTNIEGSDFRLLRQDLTTLVLPFLKNCNTSNRASSLTFRRFLLDPRFFEQRNIEHNIRSFLSMSEQREACLTHHMFHHTFKFRVLPEYHSRFVRIMACNISVYPLQCDQGDLDQKEESCKILWDFCPGQDHYAILRCK